MDQSKDLVVTGFKFPLNGREIQEIRNTAHNAGTNYPPPLSPNNSYIAATKDLDSTLSINQPNIKRPPSTTISPKLRRNKYFIGPLRYRIPRKSKIISQGEFIKNKFGSHSYLLARELTRANGRKEINKIDNLSMFTPGEMSNR